jgi:hypothetical protein
MCANAAAKAALGLNRFAFHIAPLAAGGYDFLASATTSFWTDSSSFRLGSAQFIHTKTATIVLAKV